MIASSRLATSAGSTPGRTIALTSNSADLREGLVRRGDLRPPASRRGPAHCRGGWTPARRAPPPATSSAAAVLVVEPRHRPDAVAAASRRRDPSSSPPSARQASAPARGRHALAARAGSAPKYFSTSGLRAGDVDVAGQHQHRVVRTVMLAEPALHVGEAGGVEIGHRADRRVAVRVRRREQRRDLRYSTRPIGLVVALPLLVLDDAALLIEHAPA